VCALDYLYVYVDVCIYVCVLLGFYRYGRYKRSPPLSIVPSLGDPDLACIVRRTDMTDYEPVSRKRVTDTRDQLGLSALRPAHEKAAPAIYFSVAT
jgi:hypothetical protein